jgi:hypothetical protein
MNQINKDIDNLFALAAWTCLAAVAFLWLAGVV